ncbi:MAG: vWA domain-containing protein [Myxococcaceae bacterium]
MLTPQLTALRARLDALKEGRVLEGGLLGRARALFDRGEVGTLEVLHALDRELDRAGVMTAADAKLLLELGKIKGRLGKLGAGLSERATRACEEYEWSLRRAERQLASEQLPPGALTTLEADFSRLGRAVKVADLFVAPKAPAEVFEVFARPPGPDGAPPKSAKVAVAEFWARRAADNVSDVAQKRRDVDAAYELLLRAGAEAKADADRVRKARVELAAARERIRAAPVVRSLQDLVRHLRHTARRDPGTAYRSLKALYERSIEAGDGELAKVARQALDPFLPAKDKTRELVERAQARHLLGARDDFKQAADVDEVKEDKPGGRAGPRDEARDVLMQLAYDLDEEKLEVLELASGCARLFDVEDALSEHIVEAELSAVRPVQRRVGYPTQTMTYEFTSNLDELSNFVISNPHSMIYDLASNRQVVRAFIEEEPPPRPKRIKRTAVRVYVLDASGSMHGSRARFRDAILIAELNAIRVKAREGLDFDPLYFSFFNDSPTELARVDSAAEATRQIEKLFRESPAAGQTDITLALMSAFDSIKTAAGSDPYLARATVVLVTDGEDAVDLDLIRKTKRPFEGMDIALSFISLGEENPDLKSLVLSQRAEGSRAFYHHLDDHEIGAARTEFDTAWRTLLPPDVPPTPGVLEGLLPHLEALEAIALSRPSVAPVRADSQFDALFPSPGDARGVPANAALVPRLADILDAVAEAASLAPADNRPTEAVLLLEHLLELYGLKAPEYLDAVCSGNPKLKAPLERVRLLCRPFG